MIRIELNGANREEVLDYAFSEMSKMYLHAMCLLDGRESTYEKEDYKLIEKGKSILKDHMDVEYKGNAISIDTSSTDDICFCIAGELQNENSYSDYYGSNEQSSIKYALQNMLDRFPEIIITGDFEVQGSSYYYTEIIETKDRAIFTHVDDDEDDEDDEDDDEDDEDDEDDGDDTDTDESVDKEKKYDEKAFLNDVIRGYPYSKFMETFKVNDQFTEKMYKEFLLSNFLYKKTNFYRADYSYEEFKMYIFLCIFEDENVGIEEDDYKNLFAELVGEIGDVSRYEI